MGHIAQLRKVWFIDWIVFYAVSEIFQQVTAALRKEFILINTYDYILPLIRKTKKLTTVSSFWELNGPFFEQTLIPSSKGALCQVWLNLVHYFLKRFSNFVNVFSLFRYDLPLEKIGDLYLNKLESPSLKVALCQVWLKLAQWFLRRRFLNFVFSLFRNYQKLTRAFSSGELKAEKMKYIMK